MDKFISQAKQNHDNGDVLITYDINFDVAHPVGFDESIIHDRGEEYYNSIWNTINEMLLDNYIQLTVEKGKFMTSQLQESDVEAALYRATKIEVSPDLTRLFLSIKRPELGNYDVTYTFNFKHEDMKKLLHEMFKVMNFFDNKGQFVNDVQVYNVRKHIASLQ